MGETGYDIFLSYVSADRAWVEGYLIPALGLPPERVFTTAAFTPGAWEIKEFERAVTASRYTLLVLSPAFLTDAWAGLSDALAGQAGLGAQQEKLIPLVLQPVDLPLRLAARVRLDCTRAEGWEAEIGRLRQLLQQPAPPLEAIPCPYPGMAPFGAQDARGFFGREREIADLVGLLRAQRFLVLIGPSGSGKSSLVSAGLLPALAGWQVRVARPGAEPLAAVEAAAAALAVPEAGTAGRLLVIDQFEEVFTHPDPAQRARVLQQIQTMRAEGAFSLLLVLRADFYGDLISSPLWPVDSSQRVEVAPLQGEALRDAIQRPAAAVGVYLEADLVEALARDASGQPGPLPLMQEALAQLWERRARRLLTADAYRQMGRGGRSGLAVAIATRADAVYAALPPDSQPAARRIFLRLVQFGEGREDTRRQQPVSALLDCAATPQEARQVLGALASGRLLVLSGQESPAGQAVAGEEGRLADLAHEALIGGWPRLRDEWIPAYKQSEQARRRLQARAADWEQTGRRGGLLDAVELVSARRWLASPEGRDLGLDAPTRAYLDASALAARRAQRRRWLTPAAAVVGVVVLALAVLLGLAAIQRQRAAALNPTVRVPGGAALIGDPSGDLADSSPAFQTTLKPFLLQSHEVTNAEYCLCQKVFGCAGKTPSQGKGVCDAPVARLPVTEVTWSQAAQYCAWIDGRLPTEFEWEWAASGPDKRLYPTGSAAPVPGQVNIRAEEDSLKDVWPVDAATSDLTPGYQPPNLLRDLTGNAREWTSSPHAPYPRSPDQVYATAAGAGTVVARGASFRLTTASARSFVRFETDPTQALPDIGFRCVMH